MFFKILIICFIFLNALRPDCAGLSEFKDLYFSIDTKDELTNFIEVYEDHVCAEMTPYIASATMLQARYTLFPHKKLKYFYSGKKMLEAYIMKYPDDIEGRYVRLITQMNTPGFLNYRKNISEDRIFMENNIDKSELSIDYKNRIIETISELNSK